MPVFIPPDTARALTPSFSGCESRSLFKDKFNLFDSAFDEDKLVSLDLFLNNGRSDIDRLRQGWEVSKEKQERNLSQTPERFSQRELDKAEAALSATRFFANSGQTTPKPVAYARGWLSTLPESQICQFSLFTASRLLVGLANGTLENAGCSLHPRYGFPMIPGSALKGVARDAARAIGMDAATYRQIFGGEPGCGDPYKGKISFLDAFAALEPEQRDLEADIVTPHYQKYYGKTGNEGALDEESPIPSVFPAVRAGVKFDFALIVLPRGDSAELAVSMLNETAKVLKHALLSHGIGAKTSAGYGYFSETEAPHFARAVDLFPPPPKPQLSPEEEFAAKWQGQTGNTFRLKYLIADLKAIESVDLLQSVFEAVMPAEHLANFRSSNPYWSAFMREGGKVILDTLNRKLPRS